jgi:hypothetical protein
MNMGLARLSMLETTRSDQPTTNAARNGWPCPRAERDGDDGGADGGDEGGEEAGEPEEGGVRDVGDEKADAGGERLRRGDRHRRADHRRRDGTELGEERFGLGGGQREDAHHPGDEAPPLAEKDEAAEQRDEDEQRRARRRRERSADGLRRQLAAGAEVEFVDGVRDEEDQAARPIVERRRQAREERLDAALRDGVADEARALDPLGDGEGGDRRERNDHQAEDRDEQERGGEPAPIAEASAEARVDARERRGEDGGEKERLADGPD